MAVAAPPILASTIYRSHTGPEAATESKRRRLRTGWRPIDDEVFDGGLHYGLGGIVSLCSERDFDVSQMLFTSLLTNHLLPRPSSSNDTTTCSAASQGAFYIDTTGSFSAAQLLADLRSHLQRTRHASRDSEFTHGGGYTYRRRDADENDSVQRGENDQENAVDREAMQALDRVSLMRVLDFEGIIEVVGEIRESLAAISSSQLQPPSRCDDAKAAPPQDDNGKGRKRKSASRDAIPSSQTPSPSPSLSPPPGVEPPSSPERPAYAPPNLPSETLILLPNLSRLLTPLMHNNHIRGHALLLHLLRALRHLTTSYPVCIVIGNYLVPTSSTLRKGNLAGEAAGPASGTSNAVFEESDSCFEGVGLRMSLGKAFAWGIDLAIGVWEVGRWLRKDKDVPAERGKKQWVMEVIKDDSHSRTGRWAVWTSD